MLVLCNWTVQGLGQRVVLWIVCDPKVNVEEAGDEAAHSSADVEQPREDGSGWGLVDGAWKEGVWC